MITLAELTMQNAGPFLTVVVGAGSLMGILLLAVKLWNETGSAFGRKPPVDVDLRKLRDRMAEHEATFGTLATKKELEELRQSVTGNIDAKFRVLDEKRSDDVAKLHQHVENTAVNFHKRLNDVSESISQEIHGLPKMVFSMLKDTGAI